MLKSMTVISDRSPILQKKPWHYSTIGYFENSMKAGVLLYNAYVFSNLWNF